MFLLQWHTILAIYSSWDYDRSLVLSDLTNIPLCFHCTLFRRLCFFRLTTVLENFHSDTLHNISRHKLPPVFLAATKQLYKWYFPSVRLSVTPFWLCSHHRIIMQFSGVITNDQSKVHAKGQGQRSKVKVTEVTTQLNRFRTVTPVWIHIWWWNDAYSLMLLRRGALLFFKVIRQISRSHGSKNRRIRPKLAVSGL